MQLDKTHISIRKRSILDNIDLSFSVLRDFWQPILLWSAVSILPFAILNYIVLLRQHDYDEILLSAGYDTTEFGLQVRAHWNMALIVFLQAPMVLMPVTYFLGQAVFTEQPSNKDVLKAIRKTAGRSILLLGLLRGGLVAVFAMVFVPYSSSFTAMQELFVSIIVCGFSAVAFRTFRPFLPEVIVLEECPLRSSDKSMITLGLRSRWLQSSLAGELFCQAIVIGFFALIGVLSISYSLSWVYTILFGYVLWEPVFSFIFWPLSLWTVAIVATVFRFLSYIDTRIRLEGWEIELRFRAEAERMGAV